MTGPASIALVTSPQAYRSLTLAAPPLDRIAMIRRPALQKVARTTTATAAEARRIGRNARLGSGSVRLEGPFQLTRHKPYPWPGM